MNALLFLSLCFLTSAHADDDCSAAALDAQEAALQQQVGEEWAALQELRGATGEDARAAGQAFVDRYDGVHVGVSCEEPRAVEVAELEQVQSWLLHLDLLDGIGGLIGAKGTQVGSGGLATSRGGLVSGGGGSAYSGPLLRVGVPEVKGALTVEQVRAVALQHAKAVRYCYQRRVSEGYEEQGALEVQLVIAGDGTVPKVKVKGGDLDDEQLRNCVRGRFERLLFPEPVDGGKVKVSLPLEFELP